ncbi:MAG: thioredoxin domain-containing protein [Spirulinaceae cyanobacterium]
MRKSTRSYFVKFLVLLTSLIVLLTYSLPAQANTIADSQLEQQVLEIIRNNPEVIIESVQTYQQQQLKQQQQQQQAFLQQITANPQLAIGTSPTKGATQAKVVLLEFSDFQCPFCAEASKTIKQFITNHQDIVILVLYLSMN